MRIITSAAVAAGLLSVALLGGCEVTDSGMDDQAAEEASAAEDAGEEAAAAEGDESAEATAADLLATAIEKADACRAIAEEANEVGMAAVQDQWDGAGCETLGDDLDAAREANAGDEAALAALDEASRPIEE